MHGELRRSGPDLYVYDTHVYDLELYLGLLAAAPVSMELSCNGSGPQLTLGANDPVLLTVSGHPRSVELFHNRLVQQMIAQQN